MQICLFRPVSTPKHAKKTDLILSIETLKKLSKNIIVTQTIIRYLEDPIILAKIKEEETKLAQYIILMFEAEKKNRKEIRETKLSNIRKKKIDKIS